MHNERSHGLALSHGQSKPLVNHIMSDTSQFLNPKRIFSHTLLVTFRRVHSLGSSQLRRLLLGGPETARGTAALGH